MAGTTNLGEGRDHSLELLLGHARVLPQKCPRCLSRRRLPEDATVRFNASAGLGERVCFGVTPRVQGSGARMWGVGCESSELGLSLWTYIAHEHALDRGTVHA